MEKIVPMLENPVLYEENQTMPQHNKQNVCL